VAFTVYTDDSGTAPSQQVANATALIIPATKIVDLEKEMEKLKNAEGFSDFHTSVFVARNHKSEFAKWDEKKQKRVFRRMRQITRKYVTQIFSIAVYKKHYDSVVPAEIRKYTGKYPYSWALRHVLPWAQMWRVPFPDIPAYEWVFDWMEPNDPARREVEEILEQAEEDAKKKRNVDGDYRNFHFRSRKFVAGLQCADLVAWTNYQFALKGFCGTPLHPFARKAWDDFQAMPASNRLGFQEPIDWNHAITIKREHLRTWVQKELADGRSIAQFQEWEKRKLAQKAKLKK
jgi:hypothetical protein